MSPSQPIVQQAMSLPTPKGKTWASFLCSRFAGTIPPKVTEAPTAIEIIPSDVELDASATTIKGHYEYSMDLATARYGIFTGEIDRHSRAFHFRSTSKKDPWLFDGTFSENGQVMILRLGWDDGYKSDEFCLIQEDTFASLLPEDELNRT